MSKFYTYVLFMGVIAFTPMTAAAGSDEDQLSGITIDPNFVFPVADTASELPVAAGCRLTRYVMSIEDQTLRQLGLRERMADAKFNPQTQTAIAACIEAALKQARGFSHLGQVGGGRAMIAIDLPVDANSIPADELKELGLTGDDPMVYARVPVFPNEDGTYSLSVAAAARDVKLPIFVDSANQRITFGFNAYNVKAGK